MGDPIRMPSSVITALPYSALSNPPWPPGGGVICVNRCQDIPASPCDSSVHRIAARQARPNAVATSDSARKMPFFALRSVRRVIPRNPRRSNRRSMAWAAAITVKVMRNSNSPSAMSEEV